MKKSIISLAVVALLASPAVVFAAGEENTGLIQNLPGTEIPDSSNAGWVDPFAPHVTPENTVSFGPGAYKAEFVAEASNPTPKANQEPVYEEKTVSVNGVTGTKAVLVGYVDKSGAKAAPKAEDKKEDTKATEKKAANDVKPAATKTGSKALPKTSAAK